MAHLHCVYDGDTHFKIDPITRKIENTTGKVILMQNDHNSERFTFEMPRFIEGHDMSICNKVEIHYNNTDTKTKDVIKDVYESTDLQISPDSEDVVICSWLISSNATKYAGSLYFVLRFACLTDSTIDYQWFTDIYKDITISKSIFNTETVAINNADILEQWREEIEELFNSGSVGGITKAEVDVKVSQAKTELIGLSGDEETANTINGAKNYAKNEVDGLRQNTTTKTAQIKKRVTNLEQGIVPSPFEKDDTVAYSKIVPENALPYAKISKVGGITRKCTNLIPYPYFDDTKTVNGITFTNNGDGSVTINGTATNTADFFLFKNSNDVVELAEGTTYVSNMPNGCRLMGYDAIQGAYPVLSTGGSSTTMSKTFSLNQVYISVTSGITLNNIKLYPMLNEGTTALPYEPYFEGLRSSSVTEVESVGKNLMPSQEFRVSVPLVLKAGVIYTVSAANGAGALARLKCEDDNHNMIASFLLAGQDKNTNRSYTPFRLERDCAYVAWSTSSSTEITILDGQVEYGSKPTAYEPYKLNTLPLPESVQALDGYGWGINESAYNYIDFEKKQFVQRVGCMFINDNVFKATYDYANVVYYYISKPLDFVGYNSISNSYIVPRFEAFSSDWDDASHIGQTTGMATYGSLWFGFPVGTTLEEAKATLVGLPLYYELAEPIITDISDILSDDNYIEVESGGTVTMVNEFEYAVPSEITYQIKGTPIDESAIEEAFIKLKKEIEADYASKDYVDQEIATFDFIKVVTALPEKGLENRFYLVPKKDAETQDFFDEYMWTNKGTEESPDWDWEWVTTKQVEVDLTNYTTLDKVEELMLERSKKEHEVGSLYLSMVSTNPAQIFGFGTWMLIAQDRFPIGAGNKYAAGDMGGEETHVLTAKELPKQEGTIVTHGTYSGTPIADASGVFTKEHIVSGKYLSGSQGTSANSIDVIGYSNGGEGAAHNNIPPYFAVYIWQRTA